ncbi:hypothetical protein, conserved [Plasmodium gonderi]|uniref:Guanine nucleotide-binding protein-like 3 N-terminal domain-containing protein n=1 Tax=Plasmodium gonderi TaxID=77519 RepID=A0A1Y1JFG6_PLAGO|nr:hypothetical protein, conserved [Plasmodium gonderi]GAW81271.1 hypothetical protein, conserved [Plasmodium gonderi]
MVKLGKISKRQPLKQKYAITKKVAAHKKKLKKIIKKTKIHNRRSTKKSLKIPECIFKKDILNNIKIISSTKKKKNKEDEEICKEVSLENYDDCTLQNMMYALNISPEEIPHADLTSTVSSETMQSNFAHSNNVISVKTTDGDLISRDQADSGMNNFYNYLDLNFVTKMHIFEKAKEELYPMLKEKYLHVDDLLEIIRNCDAIFYLVDIRNPLVYLEEDIINFIKKCKKEIIFILNKCDLVDSSLIEQWLYFFRNFYLTIPFTCYERKNPTYLSSGRNKQNTDWSQGNLNNVSHHGTNNNIYLTSIIKSFFNTNKKITFGVIGYIYTGRSSFLQLILRAFSCTNPRNKITAINVAENINFYSKCGIILRKNLNGIGLIKKLHVLSNNERLVLLSEFLLSLSGKNLIKCLLFLNQEELANKYKNYFTKNIDKEEKLEKKKEIIRLIFLKQQNGNELENENINSKNVTKVYNKLFLNKIPYYVIPKEKLSLSPEQNNNQNNDIRNIFSQIVSDIYPKIDDFIISQKKKFDDYIIIKSDKFNYNV